MTPADETVTVRPLTRTDVPAFLDLVDALAGYEKLPGPSPDARARLAEDATTDPPRFHVLLAQRGGRPIGYAAYFFTYSTFLARPTLYLEDIFVLEAERRSGIGQALMRKLAGEAKRHDCGRIEWEVLTWNEPAIRFYQGLGAEHLAEWRGYRLTVDQISKLAGEGDGSANR